jgi:bifunctional enzyme CysN/CysC
MTSSFATTVVCGSVDDGKSTIIGRLLVESGSIPTDHVEQARTIRRSGSTIPLGEIDFSLLTDGLESEREQGITIDVAFRQMELSSGKRINFADSPGHEQYTRNMVVAASGAQIALLLVDAQRGPRPQTVRHATICSLMGVRKLIVAINKIDSVDYQQESFENLKIEISEFLPGLDFEDVLFIPVSGLVGDNVSELSERTDWYTGPTLLSSFNDLLTVQVSLEENLRIPIQNILRTDSSRFYAGKLVSGQVNVGDVVKVLPSNTTATVAEIIANGDGDDVVKGQSIAIRFDSEIDVSRGEIVVSDSETDSPSRVYLSELIWLTDKPHQSGTSYLLKCGPMEIPCTISDVKYVRDMESRAQIRTTELNINDVARVEITLARTLLLDPYLKNRDTGGFILCDRLTNETVAAGMVVHGVQRESEVLKHNFAVDRYTREIVARHKSCVVWLTGLPSSGKSTIADELDKRLMEIGYRSFVIDGDAIRSGLSSDLAFAPSDRTENVRRVGHVAEMFIEAGVIAIVALVSPIRKDRDAVRELFSRSDFYEVHVNTPLEICESRDTKGLYGRAVSNMTGKSQEYEAPLSPELIINGDHDLAGNVDAVFQLILDRQKQP